MNFSRLLNQTVTRWPVDDPLGDGGYAYGSPVTFAARWQDKIELFVSAAGKEEHSQAIVYSIAPVHTGDYLFLGISTETSPLAVEGAKEVRAVGSSPSIDATQHLNKAWL